MDISLPGIDLLLVATINRLENRCNQIGDEIVALHNTICLVNTRLEGLERRLIRREEAVPITPEIRQEDNEGWTVVERRRR